MKMKFIALCVIAVLPLMAFDCITDFSNVTVSLNLQPITASFPLNQGNKLTYGGTSPSIDLSSLFDQGYTLTNATLYDIRVQTIGPDNLGQGSGTVSIIVGGVTTPIFSYNGTWTAFNTPQSLITSQFITQNPTGVAALTSAVTSRSRVMLSVSGNIASPPSAPATDFISVAVYIQASGHK